MQGGLPLTFRWVGFGLAVIVLGPVTAAMAAVAGLALFGQFFNYDLSQFIAPTSWPGYWIG